MRIDELYIRSFGKLKDFRLTPSENFNVIYGENEAGKSTILAFIRQMLYGGRERKRYQPRDGSSSSGTLLFRHGGKKYLLDRTFGATRKSDTITLKNADTGTLIPVPLKQEPGEWLFDLVEDTFTNTIYIGQLACVFNGPKMGAGVVTKLSNLNWSGDEELSFAKTDERLKRAVNALSFRGRGRIPDAQRQLAALEEEQRNLNISQEILHKKNRQLITLKKEKEKAQSHRRNCENYLKICNARQELEDFTAMAEIQSEIEKIEQEQGAAYAQGQLSDDLLRKAKGLYRECEKADAVIASCETDFADQDARYKTFLKEYESISSIADIDFDKVDRLTDTIEPSEEAEGKSRLPLWIPGGIVACLVLTVLFVLLSLKQFLLLIPAILAAVGALLFAVLYQKNSSGVVDSRAVEEAENELSLILQRAGCEDLESLMRKKAELEAFQLRLHDFKAVRSSATENLKSAKSKKTILQNNLFHLLLPVAKVNSLSQALTVIEEMEGVTAQGERELSVLKAKLDTLLAGRDFSALQKHAAAVREELSKIKNLEQFDPAAADDCRKELEDLDVEISEKTTNIARLEGEIESANPDGKTPEALKEEIEDCRTRLAAYQAYFSAAELARTALGAANEEMGNAFAPAINVSAAKILSEITAGRYDDVRVSSDLEPVVLDKEDRAIVAKETLSSGTVDQLYLALRLAVAEKLFEGAEPMPLLMDEAMAQYDDTRMAQAIAYLTELPQQILFFTCQKREVDVAAGYDNVNVINLP